MPNNKDIAIIGMRGLFPEADDLEMFYENLKSGRDSVRPVSDTRLGSSSLDMSLIYRPFAYLERIDTFDHKFFKISKSEAEMMEPSQRIFLEMAVKAIENAGYRLEDLDGSNTAVYLASRNWAAIQYYLLANHDDNPSIFTGTLSAMIYGRISNLLNLQGPTMMIDAACASSLIAVTEACDKLLKGEVDYAIAGGLGININLMEVTDRGHLGTYSAEARCKTFDASADGVAAGEGGGLVLLKRLEDAIRDGDMVHAVIKGGATCHNGSRSNGITAPSPQAQAQVIQLAWKNAAIDPDTIGYIETHGTGTKLGDPIEFSAITEAFNAHSTRRKNCAVSAVKSNIGHLGSGAGIAGVIKAVLSLKHKQLFPSLHFKDPNPYIDFENTAAYVNTTLQHWEATGTPRRCGVSAFGLSGTNAHIVLEEYAGAPQEATALPAHYLLKVAAKSAAALHAYAGNIRSFLAGISGSWSNALYTLNRGRSDYNYRLCFNGNNKEELLQQLDAYINANGHTGNNVKEVTAAREVVLLLGNGGLGTTALLQYIRDYEVFGEVFNSLCPGFPAQKPEGDLLVFVTQYALCRQLQAFGIKLPVVIGAGIGRFTSRVIKGELPLQEAVVLLKAHTSHLPPDKDKFRTIVKDLQEKKAPVFLELGNDGAMTALLQDWAAELNITNIILYPLPDGQYSLLPLFATLYNAGVVVDWEQHYTGKAYRKIECPVYPFEKIRCWFKEPTSQIGESVQEAVTAESKFRNFINSVASVYTPTQLKLAEIWHDVLKLDSVELDDGFYDLGGHSLNIMGMLNRVAQQMNVTLSIEELLYNCTLAGIAAHIDEVKTQQDGKVADNIPRTTTGDYFELSHAQLRLWLLHQVEAGREAYNMPTAYRLEGKLDISAMEKALNGFIARHESLRSVFVLRQGVPQQKILPVAATGFALQVHDLRGLPDAEEVAATQIKAAAGTAFDLATGPIIRAHLFRLAEDLHIFMIVLHHISSDGSSMEILRNEVLQYYKAALLQQEPPLQPLNIHYKDYAAWQNERIRNGYFDQHKAYWKKRLAGLQPVSLEKHFDYLRPSQEDYEAGCTVFFLPAATMLQLKALGNNSTLFINTLLIFQVLLSAYTESTDIVVGTPVGGREHTDLENQVGIYLNTLLLRTAIDKHLPFEVLLDKVREQVFKDYRYQAYPFDLLVDELNLRNSLNAFETGFTWSTRKASGAADELEFEIAEYATGFNKAKADLWLHVTEMTDGLQIGFLYKKSLFREDTILLLSERFQSLIEQCIQNPAIIVGDLNLDIMATTDLVKSEITFDFSF